MRDTDTIGDVEALVSSRWRIHLRSREDILGIHYMDRGAAVDEGPHSHPVIVRRHVQFWESDLARFGFGYDDMDPLHGQVVLRLLRLLLVGFPGGDVRGELLESFNEVVVVITWGTCFLVGRHWGWRASRTRS